jgi:hypothetical protein
VVAHVGRWEEGEGADGVVDAEVDGVVVEAGVVTAVAEVEVLSYAGAEVGGLADVDADSVEG